MGASNDGTQTIAGFDTYPYVSNTATLNGMSLQVCDLQVDDTHDDNSLSCSQLQPNTIDADGGSWLFAVTGAGALDHWQYPIHLPPNTRVLLWLTNKNGTLVYHQVIPCIVMIKARIHTRKFKCRLPMKNSVVDAREF